MMVGFCVEGEARRSRVISRTGLMMELKSRGNLEITVQKWGPEVIWWEMRGDALGRL